MKGNKIYYSVKLKKKHPSADIRYGMMHVSDCLKLVARRFLSNKDNSQIQYETKVENEKPLEQDTNTHLKPNMYKDTLVETLMDMKKAVDVPVDESFQSNIQFDPMDYDEIDDFGYAIETL